MFRIQLLIEKIEVVSQFIFLGYIYMEIGSSVFRRNPSFPYLTIIVKMDMEKSFGCL